MRDGGGERIYFIGFIVIIVDFKVYCYYLNTIIIVYICFFVWIV